MTYTSLHDRLRGDIQSALKKDLRLKNIHALPRVEKVIVNVGINKMKMEGKEMQEYIGETLKHITGQKPVFRKSRKAISNFKTRKGLIVGAMVTLRGRKMEEFLDRLLSVVLPRIRDFRGLSPKLDGRGNYAIGIGDHTIFPEVPGVEAGKIFGMQVQITTTAGDDVRGMALLRRIGVPFVPEKKGKNNGEGQGSDQPSSASGGLRPTEEEKEREQGNQPPRRLRPAGKGEGGLKVKKAGKSGGRKAEKSRSGKKEAKKETPSIDSKRKKGDTPPSPSTSSS